MFKAFSVVAALAILGTVSIRSAAAASDGHCHHQSSASTAQGQVVPNSPPASANGTTQTRRFSYEPEMGTAEYRMQTYRSPSRRSQSFGIRGAGSKVRGQY